MWLVANDLEVYAEEFSNKNVDGKQLLNLDGSKLKVRLGVYPSLTFGKIFKGKLFFLLSPRPTCFGLKAEATSGEGRGKKTLAWITIKGVVSRQSSSFCLILRITRRQSLVSKEIHVNDKIRDPRQTNMSPEHYF